MLVTYPSDGQYPGTDLPTWAMVLIFVVAWPVGLWIRRRLGRRWF